MKNLPFHLPENKQYEIWPIVDILRDVVNAEKIILFGSHAKGTQVEPRYQTKDSECCLRWHILQTDDWSPEAMRSG